ncbi:MAG: hypothetical protein RJA49_1225 [Actinomycetota bacterium]
MNRTKWSAGILASAALLFAGVGVGAASAAPAAPSVTPTPTTFQLPFMGAALTVAVTTGPGGNLADVAITPADGMVATKLSPRAVVFTNADGTVKVTVKSKHGSQSVSAKAGSLADIAGAGFWTGDVFGDGTSTTVNYTIIDNAGVPDITVDGVTDPTAVPGDVQHNTDDEGGSSARVSITFTKDGQSRSLTISAKVEPADDHESDDDDNASTTSVDPAAPPAVEASVRVTLSRLRGVPVDAAAAAGPKTWTGQLCDGTDASIAYTLNADGTITEVTATPDASRIKTDDNGSKIEVRWGDHERVRISAHLDNGQITLNINDKIRCKDAADPTVNTPTSLDASNGDHQDGDHHGGGHHGGGDNNNTDTTAVDGQNGGGGHHGGGDNQQDD